MGEFAVFSTVIAANGEELSFVVVTRLMGPVAGADILLTPFI